MINPIFFADLAASNNYEIEKISLANSNGNELKLEDKHLSIMFEQIKPHRNDSKFNKIIEIAKTKIGKNILLVVILKKISDDKFKSPLQGKYLSDIVNFESDYVFQEKGSAEGKNQISDSNKRK